MRVDRLIGKEESNKTAVLEEGCDMFVWAFPGLELKGTVVVVAKRRVGRCGD